MLVSSGIENDNIYKNDIVIGISQSGETADTIAALKIAEKKDVRLLECVIVLILLLRD